MHHTNAMITSKILRKAYASELWQSRIYKAGLPRSEWWAFRLGMESGFWAMQKIIHADLLK